MKKILFGSAAAVLIAAGVYFNFRMSETWREKLQVSELTLKNLEAMGCDGSGVECDIFPDCQQGLTEPTEGKEQQSVWGRCTWRYGDTNTLCSGSYIYCKKGESTCIPSDCYFAPHSRY